MKIKSFLFLALLDAILGFVPTLSLCFGAYLMGSSGSFVISTRIDYAQEANRTRLYSILTSIYLLVALTLCTGTLTHLL